MNNLILATDSYKLNHWHQYPDDTEVVYSYFESRKGAEYDETVFFGLQAILRDLEGCVVTMEDVERARDLATIHFGSETLFNYEGWRHVAEDLGGRLPIRIKAVPEGLPVPVGNVLMTVENTDPDCFWLTNALESLLTHVWYPSTVATRSRGVKKMLAKYLQSTGGTLDGLPFMLHDFGYRGAATHDAAALGGAGHLVNFVGTDTLPAMLLALDVYGATPETLAFSVPATEHSVMTSWGEKGEREIVRNLLRDYPTGILSVVADSYNIYRFVDNIMVGFKEQIMARDGVFVLRPDSVTDRHKTPAELTVALVSKVYEHFGGEVNPAGYVVLDPHVRVLWGDGIDPTGIDGILYALREAGYAAENMVFGMGGGLLQKVNRDTQRFAFKCSAQKRQGTWHDVQKKPLDASKTSKAGRLKLIQQGGEFMTVRVDDSVYAAYDDVMRVVFEDGQIVREQQFEEIRERAAL